MLANQRFDDLNVHFYSSANPLAPGDGGLEEVLEIVERHLGELMPNRVRVHPHRKRRYSRAVAMKLFATRGRFDHVTLSKDDSAGLWVDLPLHFYPGFEDSFDFWLSVTPLDFYRDEALGLARSQQLVTFVREMARRFPPLYAQGHNTIDEELGRRWDPKNPIPKKVEEVYWLNLYGRQLVESLGRERVLSTPAEHLEELPDGGVLFLTRPTPADFASDESRIAQARALSHLNPEFSFDQALARQRQRSAHLAPVERNWDPDLVELLEYVLDRGARSDRQVNTARLNAWRPVVSEWKPLAEAPPGEGKAAEQVVLPYASDYAEALLRYVAPEEPEIKTMKVEPSSLTPLDRCFLKWDYPERAPEEVERRLIPLVGAFLGELLVEHLGGRWVGRRNLEECYVALGDRAWFPFLRARRYLHDKQSVLDYSLTKFFREAERHARGRPGSP